MKEVLVLPVCQREVTEGLRLGQNRKEDTGRRSLLNFLQQREQGRAGQRLPASGFPSGPAGSARVTCEAAPEPNCTEIKLLCQRLG